MMRNRRPVRRFMFRRFIFCCFSISFDNDDDGDDNDDDDDDEDDDDDNNNNNNNNNNRVLITGRFSIT